MTFLTWSLNLLYPVLPLYFSGRGSCKDFDDPVVLRFSAFIGEPMIYINNIVTASIIFKYLIYKF